MKWETSESEPEDIERKQREIDRSLTSESDGWGEPTDTIPPTRPEQEPAEDAGDNECLVSRRNYEDDGWGPDLLAEVPSPKARLRSESSEQAETQVGSSMDQSTDLPPSVSIVRDLEQRQARRTVDDALKVTNDAPPDGGEMSHFRAKVARSDGITVESLGEAEDYARDNIGIERVDFSDFDQRTANEVNATIETLRDEYPAVEGLEYLGTIQGRNTGVKAERAEDLGSPNPECIAQTLRATPGFNGIAINGEWADRYDETVRRLEEDEALDHSAKATGSISGVTTHEFGHLIENHLIARGGYTPELSDAISRITSNGKAGVIADVGVYATKNEHELFAELFAEYKLSSNPREPARIVGEIIDKELKVR